MVEAELRPYTTACQEVMVLIVSFPHLPRLVVAVAGTGMVALDKAADRAVAQVVDRAGLLRGLARQDKETLAVLAQMALQILDRAAEEERRRLAALEVAVLAESAGQGPRQI